MATVTKDFRVKHGLVVEGTNATVNASDIITEDAITGGTQTNISVTYNPTTKLVSFVAENGVADSNTDALAEGTTNKYFTDERAQDAVGNAVGTGLTYNDTSGAISVTTNTYDAYGSASTVAGNLSTHTSATEAHGATGAVVGTTNTQTLTNKTLTSPKINEDVALTATATELNYVDGVTSAIQTQLDGKLDESGGTMTGAIAMGTNKITGLGTPTDAADAATKAYVDSAAQGVDWKASVRAATTAAVTLASGLENGDTLDGVTLATGNRILVKDQATGSENGIYVVAASGAPTRSTDADTEAEVTSNFAVFVEEGTINADQGYVLTNNGTVTIGTTELAFTQFTGLGQIIAGTGLDKTGNTIDIDSTVTTLTGTQTLSNKTLTTPTINGPEITATGGTPRIHGIYLPEPHVITFEGSTTDEFETVLTTVNPTADRTVSLPDATTTLVGKDTVDTLTNKTLTSPKINEDVALTATATELNYVDGVTSAIQTQLDAKATPANITTAIDALTTTAIEEGTNLYFTDARAVSALQAVVPDFTEIEVNNIVRQVAATVSAPTAASAVTAYAFAKASYRSAKFLVKVAYSTHTEVSEVLLTLDTSDNIAITEYAVVGTNGSSSTISADIDGSNVRLRVTPVNASSTVKVYGTLIA